MKNEISFFKISNGALLTESLPDRLKILAWSSNPSCRGQIEIGLKTLSALPRQQKESGYDRVAIDYEHNTVDGTPAFLSASAEPRKVAGYGVPKIIAPRSGAGSDPEAGLWLTDIEWTPSGSVYAREYSDLSPAVRMDNGEVVFLHSVALCRQGAVEDLRFYSVEPKSSNSPQQTKSGDTMDYRKEMLRLLGMEESATDEQLAEAISAYLKKMKDSQDSVAALSASVEELKKQVTAFSATNAAGTSTASTSAGEVVALTAKVAVLEGNITKFNAELEKRDRAAAVERASREGKVIPLSADQIAAMPMAVLDDMIRKLPATVPLTTLTPAGFRDSMPGSSAITENDKAIAAKCGIKL